MTGLERFSDRKTFEQYQDRLKDAWERFTSGENVEPDRTVVPFRIAQSWKRSRGYGLDPARYQSFVRMKKLNLKEQEKHLLASGVWSGATWLGELARRQDFCISIFDAHGNHVALPQENDRPPSFANEMILGTNATALALLEDRPGCVLGYEHYSRFFHQQLCVAAPFHAPNQDLVGAVCVSTQDFDSLPAIRAMVEGLVQLCALTFALAHQSADGDEESHQAVLARLIAPQQYLAGQKAVQPLNPYAQELLQKYGKNLHPGAVPRRTWQVELHLEDGPETAQPSAPEEQEPVMDQARTGCSMEFSDIVGSTPKLLRCIRFAKQAAPTAFPIVLNGESGSGKEVFAQAIHNASSRREMPFVAVNCGAISPELVESELFGYEEGSFTDASRQGKRGLLEEASGGTLFLDEVESMPLPVQAKLLRVLSAGKVTRVGGTEEVPVDLRVIAASKANLRQAAAQGAFREDLFYRISAVSLDIPPLRQRREDIPLLVRHFLDIRGWRSTQVDPEAMQVLCFHDWPGNVRELENVLTHGCIFSQNGAITLDSLPEELVHSGRVRQVMDFLQKHGLLGEDGAAGIDQIEAALIRSALEENDFVLKRTAAALHIDRKTLCAKLKRDPDLSALEFS